MPDTRSSSASIARARRSLGRSLTAPSRISAYDVRERRLLALAEGARTVRALSPRLEPLGSNEAVPVEGAGRLRLDVDARDSTLILTREGSRRFATMRWHPAGPTVRTVAELHAGADARPRRQGDRALKVVVDGRLATFTRDGVRIADTPFDGAEAGALCEIAGSTVSVDRRRARLPEARDGSWHAR